MGRRTVILIVALVIALVGSAMVYLYVRGADERAQAKQEPVEVLKAVAQIEPGESLSQAQAAGKLELQPVPREQLLEGVMDSVGESGGLVAVASVYPNEQITTSKFGAPGEQDRLTLERGEIAISVDLNDTGRVAGFVAPGSEVAVFYNGTLPTQPAPFLRVLLPKVKVIAVGPLSSCPRRCSRSRWTRRKRRSSCTRQLRANCPSACSMTSPRSARGLPSLRPTSSR
jgi:pilus assembly protein CpaB